MHAAAEAGHVRVAEVLLAKGAKVDLCTDTGEAGKTVTQITTTITSQPPMKSKYANFADKFNKLNASIASTLYKL